LGLFTQTIKDYLIWKPLTKSVDTATETLKKVNKLESTFKIIKKRAKAEDDNLKVLKAIGNQGLFLIEAINKIINSIPEDVFLVNIESVWDLLNSGKKDKVGGKGGFVTKGEIAFKNDDKPKETLRIIVKGESYAPNVSYIEEKVKNPIVNLTLLNQQIPVFSNVTLVQGSVKHVTVLENNGIEEDANGDTQSRPISFEIQCIANTTN
jgi:hypothetical protein